MMLFILRKSSFDVKTRLKVKKIETIKVTSLEIRRGIEIRIYF